MNMTRKLTEKYGLVRAYKKDTPAGHVVRKLLVLHFIPAEHIESAYASLRADAPEDQRLDQLFWYMDTWW